MKNKQYMKSERRHQFCLVFQAEVNVGKTKYCNDIQISQNCSKLTQKNLFDAWESQ